MRGTVAKRLRKLAKELAPTLNQSWKDVYKDAKKIHNKLTK